MAEAREIFEAESRSLQEVLGSSGTGFYIPAYQRSYAWEKKKVDRLLADLMLGFEQLADDEKVFSFLGTVILIHDINYTTIDPMVKSDVPSQVLNVIDGQQRLSTLIALCIAIHAEIAAQSRKLANAVDSPAATWLTNQVEDCLGQLDACFRFEKSVGQGAYYPRMIRAFDDQWAKSSPRYDSPIASLASQYSQFVSAQSGSKFAPTEGESRELFQRFRDLQKYVRRVSQCAVVDDDWTDDRESRPDPAAISGSERLQRELVKFPLSPEELAVFVAESDGSFRDLAVLVMYAQFVLKRVAITTVTGKNEDYAFEVFESLNTTGEPLTAFETFKPRVVRAEQLEKYGTSDSKKCIDRIDSWLDQHEAKKRPGMTRELIALFALVEDGRKESLSLTSQRKYLQRSFDLAREEGESLPFLEDMRDVARFRDMVWDRVEKEPKFEGLQSPVSDELHFCLRALALMNHSIAAAPIIRYYSEALRSDRSIDGVIESAEAALSFTVLWRSATGSTAGIDGAYRDLMRGPLDGATGYGFPGLARRKANPIPPISELKRELVRLLWSKLAGEAKSLPKGKSNREVLDQDVWPLWRATALETNLYAHPLVLKLLLLAAHEDSVPDSAMGSGTIIRGAKTGSDKRMTVAGLAKYGSWTVEHIAPQNPAHAEDWPSSIYDSPSTIHTIGNLVLLPARDNSMLTNRAWASKVVLYAALGMNDIAKATSMLDESGLAFKETTKQIASQTSYVPDLEAIGTLRGPGDTWSIELVEARGARLLELAWEKYTAWIE